MVTFLRGLWIQLFLISISYALPFSVTPLSPLPTHVAPGGKTFISYLIRNTTTFDPPSNMIKWLPSNATINPQGTTCTPTNAFKLAPNQTCVLNLDINGPISKYDLRPHEHLFICMSDKKTCAGPLPENALNVSLSSGQQTLAYIADNQNVNTISICSVGSNGHFTHCYTHTDPSFAYPIDVVLDATNTFAYVVNADPSQISICSVNADGSLQPCTVPLIPGLQVHEGGAAIQGHFIYFTQSSSQNVMYCHINLDGSLNPCNTIDGFTYPSGRIAFSPTGQYAYVPDTYGNAILICPVNTNGAFGSCLSFTDSNITGPEGASINAAGTYLYVANTSNNPSTIAICPIANSGASLNLCTGLSDGNQTFDFPSFSRAINLLMQTSNQRAYVPNLVTGYPTPPGTVSICVINNVNGSLDNCTADANDTFINPSSVWIARF